MKFSGKIGFLIGENEIRPGVWKSEFSERPYLGNVIRNNRRYQMTDKQNADLTTSNQLSILSDLYMQQHWNAIRYVVWNGIKWQVSNIDVSYPRLTLDLGGVYNENENGTSCNTL